MVGFMSAIMLFLGTLNIQFQWLTEASINAFGVVLSAGIFLGVNLYTIYKNHYGFTGKAKQQKAWLKRADKF
ncbi:phage holin [Cytobacillus horneckiae]|uniref:phage holin n=1 Tax=Cytobacillus horneckiae TaxID=549687 RepID=UPI0023EA59B2|nr:phage holin [Cytobacillus horneckiae]MEC1157132.1 phage holin [Cytobacillus horneckiae]MED2939842.1 phage holin [Cytobacillus horneckiae]